MISDCWRSPEKITRSVVGSVCDVRTVKPWVGIAETKQTPLSPNRTDAWPPADWIVCTPEPPSLQFAGDCVAVGLSDGDGFVGEGACDVREGVGLGLGLRVGARLVAEGLGFAGLLDLRACSEGEENTVGAERATGGVGLVDPTTKCTVSITAVTLTAVHEIHMSR
ncbi:hypothetical protein [Streptomyces sp. NPDC048639]|uniref:hypothetical protein n=1 Tax=Streptomyces sp. NPDC048639 TaxID=3365581 RepID=UPI003711ED97